MKVLLIILAMLFTFSSFAVPQSGNLELGVSVNRFSSNYYENVSPGKSFNFDMKYFLAENVFLTSNINYGRFRYYTNSIPDYSRALDEDGTNSIAEASHFGLLAGYKLDIGNRLDVSISLGITGYTFSRSFPVNLDEMVIYVDDAWTDIDFPFRLGVDYNFWKGLSLGVNSTFYVETDFPVVEWHIGPMLTYTFGTCK